ncbi:hypothetical protein A7U60_g1708 [Sanghuangporus baumii]|uniref:DNA-directed RNA polymerase III subunit RPC9 n=1 Tax=Sanghuangporus baumii TaxID=108892 RepID=A0A9Q5I3W6_SANBA|nr:hypothetical protein A7U60_g1708 [Sanghuangporus baumii]
MSMEVLSARSALLSNYEVLTLLKELESEQLARQKTAIRIKKEEDERIAARLNAASAPNDSSLASTLVQEEVCENLRTVEFEAIQYLTADYQPTKQQSAESISQLVRDLNKFDLTKAEKLQIVNLAPTEPVELYVIVEEIEDRFGDKMDEVLDVVRSSLARPNPLFLPLDEQRQEQSAQPSSSARIIHMQEHETRLGWEEETDGEHIDEFDDLGTGAGVEGDLEMGDDNDD